MKKSTWRERRQFDSFEEHLQWVRNSTQVDVKETEEDRDKRKRRARKDYNYFVRTYFPHYASVDCADFHIRAANIILKYPRLRFVMAWFRGAAKSVHADIFLPMWLKIQQPRQINTMVLVSKSGDNARTLLSDLQAELQANAKYVQDFGMQIQVGSWEEGEFATKDGCAFFALGRGQSPRGLRKRQNRPDYWVLDDIDDDELVENPRRVKKVVDWIERALILTMDMGQGRVIYANNIIHENSIISTMIATYQKVVKELKQLGQDLKDTVNTHYHISKVNVRDTRGNITWPAKYDDQKIFNIEKELGYAPSQTELYNNPITEGKTFKKEWMQYKPMPKLNTYPDIVAYFDGGYKKTRTTDTKSLVCLGLKNGEYHILKAYCGQATRMEAVMWHYDLMEWLSAHKGTARFWMEEVFMLDLLYDDFNAAAEEKGYPVPISGDKRQKPDKDLRIEATSGAFERGAVYFNAAEQDNHHMSTLIAQYLAFEKGSNTHKDGPDAVEGGMHKLKARIRTAEPAAVGPRLKSHNRYRY